MEKKFSGTEESVEKKNMQKENANTCTLSAIKIQNVGSDNLTNLWNTKSTH